MPQVVFPAYLSNNFGFIVDEEIYRSREEIAVASGQGILKGGTIMSKNGSGLAVVWATGMTNAIVLCEDVDATSAAVKRTFIVRDAQLKRFALFFGGTPTTPQKDEAYALLAAQHVVMR